MPVPPAATSLLAALYYWHIIVAATQRLETRMLSIHLGDYPGSIYDTETYFRNSYLDSWFEDPMAAQIIKSVD